ncbi:MAG: Dihydrolipoyl dehydrogenase [Chlamydiae bacterium]|nr:Dihydrolipoyl dehydrogenase [Chlamydiota bacterium]
MTQRHTYDIIVIGSGPGGYVAAIKAAQAKKSVALIEAKDLGGTCLNWGCIPTKTLISNTHLLKKMKMCQKYGIHTTDLSFDYAQMKTRKDHVVSKIRTSLEGLLKANKIDIIRGFAKFEAPFKVKVQGENSGFYEGEKMIIATGSESRSIPAFPIDNESILGARAMLEQTHLPKRLAIIGGGVIGCEFASLYRELGVEITIFEMLDRIIPMESSILSEFLTKTFQKTNVEIKTSVQVKAIEKLEGGIQVILADGQAFDFDLALCCVGVKLNTDHIGLEKVGIVTNNGAIVVNEKMETNVKGHYAIGDITAKYMLAHVASHQGIVAAANAIGKTASMHYNAIPSVIFTDPEIASCGMTEEAAKEKGLDIATGTFPFSALGKSQASIETEGFTHIISDKKTRQILGGRVVGIDANILIAEIALAIQNELTLESLCETVHAHPTLSESWMEAAFLAQNHPLHWPPKI